MKLIITFFILSVINVIFSTVRSIVTIKSGKGIASIINAGYFAFYNLVMIYTMADFPLTVKCAITFVCNLVGVYIVKWAEERARKDKLWLVKVTVPVKYLNEMDCSLDSIRIPHSYVNITKYAVFDCYCEEQADTTMVLALAKSYDGKCFATENKL